MNASIWLAPLAISVCLCFVLGCAFFVSAVFVVSALNCNWLWPAKDELPRRLPEGSELPFVQSNICCGIPRVNLVSVQWLKLTCAASARGRSLAESKVILHPSSGHARASEILGLIGDPLCRPAACREESLEEKHAAL